MRCTTLANCTAQTALRKCSSIGADDGVTRQKCLTFLEDSANVAIFFIMHTEVDRARKTPRHRPPAHPRGRRIL